MDDVERRGLNVELNKEIICLLLRISSLSPEKMVTS